MHPWLVLPVRSGSELAIEKRVRALGYAAMAPWDKGQRRMRNGCYRDWRFPLYVGYVFVSFPDHGAGWQHLNSELNTLERKIIFQFLGGDAPAILRSDDVEYLNSIADGRFKTEDAAATIVIGDRVIVPDGHLKGQPSIVMRIRDSKKRGKRVTVKVIGEKIDAVQEFPLAMLVKA